MVYPTLYLENLKCPVCDIAHPLELIFLLQLNYILFLLSLSCIILINVICYACPFHLILLLAFAAFVCFCKPSGIQVLEIVLNKLF